MLARLATVRRVPRLLVVPVRYSSDGSVARSKEFGYVSIQVGHVFIPQLTGSSKEPRNGLTKVGLDSQLRSYTQRILRSICSRARISVVTENEGKCVFMNFADCRLLCLNHRVLD